MPDNSRKKAAAATVAFVMAMCFIILCVSIYKTGLISGLNVEIDSARQTAEMLRMKKETVEGIFTDRNQENITSHTEPGESAYANHPESFSNIIGYNSLRLGTSGLRKTLFYDLFSGGKDGVGATVQLTADATLQKKLYKLLDGSVGSITVINAKTGEILAMVSRGSPDVDYDVNKIDDVYSGSGENVKYYSDIYNGIDEFYYNRAVLAQDPPGSCAKVITAVSLVENGKEDLIYNDNGYFLGKAIHNYGYAVYGECSLQKALTKSVNTYFANGGIELGGEKLKKTFNSFMVGETVELDFTTLRSTFLAEDEYSDFVIASNSYGQGELVMSPLHIASMMGAIMNEGKMMKPYLIEKITDDGRKTYKAKKEVLSVVTDKKTCRKVKELLVNNSEGYGLSENFGEEVTITAKTGTAQVASGKGNHIYYCAGVEIDGNVYGICVDRNNVSYTGGKLQEIVVKTIKTLINEMSE